MSFANATDFIQANNESIVATEKCGNWTYDDSVMKKTIVTEVKFSAKHKFILI